MFKLTQTNA